MKKLPEDFKQRWIAALRSGEYQQTRHGGLIRDGKYCCLAVGAICLGLELDEKADQTYDAIYGRFDELFGNYVTKRTLWNMNDNDGKSFSEIADYIEKNL